MTFTIAAVGDVALLHQPSPDLFRADWDAADLRIANLEAPLTEGGVPAAKLIRLQSPLKAADWLRDDLRCDVVSLANNHIMDWGEPGLRSTRAALDRAGIRYAGAGATDVEAGAPTIFEIQGGRVAFLSWACTVPPGFRANAEHPGLAAIRVRSAYAADPFLIDEQPGTPPWVHTEPWSDDVQRLEATLAAARNASDLVILALHWGVPPQWQSNFQGPLAEYQEALAPRLVAAGADLVLGHHAHTVYGVQAFARPEVAPGLVCFSLGNYIFHPLASRRGAPLDAPSRPYHAPERPENRDTFVGTFTIGPSGDRLAVQHARLQPSVLNESWEASAAPADSARRIAERLSAFSAWRETPTRIDAGAVVWSPSV
jgi:poly-gamma-glutamate capsule biosynthesis protein CapA/YwtB (metallophosphatase superfamily)